MNFLHEQATQGQCISNATWDKLKLRAGYSGGLFTRVLTNAKSSVGTEASSFILLGFLAAWLLDTTGGCSVGTRRKLYYPSWLRTLMALFLPRLWPYTDWRREMKSVNATLKRVCWQGHLWTIEPLPPLCRWYPQFLTFPSYFLQILD